MAGNDNAPDSGRGDITHGTIGDHEVSISEGTGSNEGQTIIADGYID